MFYHGGDGGIFHESIRMYASEKFEVPARFAGQGRMYMGKSVKDIIHMGPSGQHIKAEGWVRTKRESKDITFLELNDGSTIKNLQVVLGPAMPGYRDLAARINNGCSIRAAGILVPSLGSGQKAELQASEIEVCGDVSIDEYPLQKKRHSFEFLREIAHLRPRTSTFGAIARIRSAMSHAIHTYFYERGFIYIHTPIISGSDCEGAGEMFQVTTLMGKEIPLENGGINYGMDFFGKKAYLTVSGQLEGEAYACALKNIYTFGPTFRAENSNTSRHLAEFWMIEPEMAFCDINCNMDTAEEFLKYILRYSLENCHDDMEFFNDRIDKGTLKRIEDISASEFARITYTEAIEILLKAKKNFEFPVKWGIDLQSEHEKYIAEEVFMKPVIITGYPREIKAFYMKMNDDGRTVRAMDILFPKLGEIVGGSERETDLEKLKGRIVEAGLKPEDYWWYLDLRRFGSVPHSGFGLGFERLIQYVTGMQNIRDVIPFPRCVKTLDF